MVRYQQQSKMNDRTYCSPAGSLGSVTGFPIISRVNFDAAAKSGKVNSG
eukprot:SAG11_NODE_42401_length_180_cov_345.333333_1_plen_48_part_01